MPFDLRSKREVEEETAALQAALEDLDTAADRLGEPPPGLVLLRDSLRNRSVVLAHELVEASRTRVRLILEGAPVVDHTVDVEKLVQIVGPLDQAVLAVGKALDASSGKKRPPASTVRGETRLFVSATFPGSFGLELVGPPPTELPVQLGLLDAEPDRTLLDRCVDKLVGLLEVGAASDSDEAVVDELAGLGPRVVKAVSTFADSLVKSGADLQLQVCEPARGVRRARLDRERASRIRDVLSRVDVTEEPAVLTGRLVEASLVRRTFGLQLADETVIRGAVSADVVHRVEDDFGKDIRAEITVSRAISAMSGKTVEKYRLDHFASDLD